jgi:hypothetical protein
MKITWNGFLGRAIEEYPNEVAGFLFSKQPYSPEEEWFVFPVKNVSKDPEHEWIPDKDEMHKIKQKAVKLGLVKIGNVHTHPIPDSLTFYEIEQANQPSPKDLHFARRFNDIVRGIIVIGKSSEGKDAIFGILWHDKFGKKINIMTRSDEGKRESAFTGVKVEHGKVGK